MDFMNSILSKKQVNKILRLLKVLSNVIMKRGVFILLVFLGNLEIQ